MKKLLFSGFLLLALAGRARAQAGPADIVVVRVFEGGNTVKAIITRGKDQGEKVEFERGISDKKLTKSSEGYFALYQKLYQEGYVLQNSFSTSEVNERFITLLFTKKQ